MSVFDLNDLQIYEDKNEEDIIKKIIESHDDEPFYIFDIEMVVRNHRRWLEKIPRVTPYYAVKCNPNPTLIRLLAAMNMNFDCASKQEMQLVMKAGVSKDRIIYANPIKALSHIKFAKKFGIEWTTVDTKDEILKLKNEHPDSKLIVRLSIDGSADHCGINFSRKFGCETTEAIELMEYIKKIEMTLLGFCFHLGSPCWDTKSYGTAIKICNDLLNIAKTMGHSKAKLIDIGGGMNGRDYDYFDQMAISINTALVDIDPSIKVISEPGRFYAETPFTLSARIIGKKIQKNSGDIERIYYLNESTYGSFIEELLNVSQRIPSPLYYQSDEKYLSRIWGRTCDPYDNIIKNEEMQDFKVGDWLIWKDFGAYTLALATYFNGYVPAVVYPFIRKSALNYVLLEIKNLQTIIN